MLPTRVRIPPAARLAVYDQRVQDLLTVALIALATHRLTYLIVEDRITRRPRWWLQGKTEERYERRTGQRSEEEWLSAVGYLLSCFWCMGWWVGAVVVAVTAQVASVPLPVLVWLTASSVTGLLGSGK